MTVPATVVAPLLDEDEALQRVLADEFEKALSVFLNSGCTKYDHPRFSTPYEGDEADGWYSFERTSDGFTVLATVRYGALGEASFGRMCTSVPGYTGAIIPLSEDDEREYGTRYRFVRN